MTENMPSISAVRADIELALCYMLLCFFLAIKPDSALFLRMELTTGIDATMFTLVWCIIFLVSAYGCLALKPVGNYHALGALPLAIFGSMIIVSLLLPGPTASFIVVFMVFALYLFFKNIRLQQEAKMKDLLLLKLTQKDISQEAVLAKE